MRNIKFDSTIEREADFMIPVVRLNEISEEIMKQLRRNELFPIIGSGFSRGSPAGSDGSLLVPSGEDMKKYMVEYLSSSGFEVNPNCTFSKVAKYFQRKAKEEDYWKYFRDRFTNVQLSEEKKKFINGAWKAVFTLNLDDAIENNTKFNKKILPNKQLRQEALESQKCVFKLHGDAEEIVNYKDKGCCVLGIDEYINSLQTSESMLNQLKVCLEYSNTLFLGCSLSDELDLLSIAQQLKQESSTHRNRYYVTDRKLSELEQDDLEDYGINKIIQVENYSDFYKEFNQLTESIKYIRDDELKKYCNLRYVDDDKQENQLVYLLRGKFLHDHKSGAISFPAFYITRSLERTVLNEMSKFPIQVIHGARQSGKSYFLAGLIRKIRNRDTYYFDSRASVDGKLGEKLLSLRHAVLLFDTNVLQKKALKTFLTADVSKLKDNNTNIVICANNSDQDTIQVISDMEREADTADTGIRKYSLSNKLITGKKVDSELEQINNALMLNKILPFSKGLTILDNLLYIQRKQKPSENWQIEKSLDIKPGEERTLCLLILLAQNEKISAMELAKCGLIRENAELLKKLKVTIEEDHCYLLSNSTTNNISYQVICNAKGWMMGQLKTIGLNETLTATIVDAFKLLVRAFMGAEKKYKQVEDLVKFDKINELFPIGKERGKTLIIQIYDGIKKDLMGSYQYFHQVAKCRSWGISLENYDPSDLKEAEIAALTAYHKVTEYKIENSIVHRYAYAHILNTLTIIYAKKSYIEGYQNETTIGETAYYFKKAIECEENYEAMKQAKQKDDRDEFGAIVNTWISRVALKRDLTEECKKNISSIIRNWTML